MLIRMHGLLLLIVLLFSPVAVHAYSITGTVYQGGNPFAGVGITIYDGAGAQVGSATTDAAGSYDVTNIDNGTYTLVALPPDGSGFSQQTKTGLIVNGQDLLFDITFVLGTYTLLGQVTDGQGAPVSNVTVSVSGTQSNSTKTDAGGNYSLQVTEGTYTVMLSGGTVSAGSVRLPNVSWSIKKAATNVAVSGNTTQDFALPFAVVKGQVVDSNGTGISGATVLCSAVNTTEFSLSFESVTTDGSGNFSLVAYPYSNYSLNITPPAGSGFLTTTLNPYNITQEKQQLVIMSLQDNYAPEIISGPYVTFVTDTLAWIRWQTNEPTTSTLNIVNPAIEQSIDEATSTHRMLVSGLSATASYQATVTVTDPGGYSRTRNFTISGDTLLSGLRPSLLAGSGIQAVSSERAVLTAQSNEPVSLRVRYGTVAESLQFEYADPSVTTDHLITLSGLTPNTTYYYRFLLDDTEGSVRGSAVDSFTTAATVDLDAPVINVAPQVFDISNSSAVVYWETTEPTIGGVSFNDGTQYGLVGTDILSTAHAVVLQGLTSGQQYQVAVSSTDVFGNGPVVSDWFTFTTESSAVEESLAFTVAPTVPAPSISADQLLVSWQSESFNRAEIWWGTSADNLDNVLGVDGILRSGNIVLGGLLASTQYYLQVRLYSRSGQTGPVSSAMLSATTLADTDSDADGIPDADDAFADDFNEWVDSDNDGIGNHQDADDDDDGISDTWEFANGYNVVSAADALLDEDADGLTTLQEFIAGTFPANGDSDEDGLPDGFEVDNGLNPLLQSDAMQDADGDGLTNFEEYQSGTDINKDSVPPVISIPANVHVAASGYLTEVDFGSVTAEDILDGVLSVVVDDPGPFPSGHHVVTWTAVDAAGNTATAMQDVDIDPLVDLALDQVSGEGAQVAVEVFLSGAAPAYPVQVPYTIGGVSDAADHNAVDGTLVINNGTQGSVLFDIKSDTLPEADEDLVVTLQQPVNGALGNKTTHVITITESNVAPRLTLLAYQGAKPVTTVTTVGGPVEVHAGVIDGNPMDTHTYDWSGTDNAIVQSNIVQSNATGGTVFTFDPAAMADGVYTVALDVADSGTPSQSVSGYLYLAVQSSAPVLDPVKDSDGDGIKDVDEGPGDDDADGVPNYLDAVSFPYLMGATPDGAPLYMLSTQSGLHLSLGRIAMAAKQYAPRLAMDIITGQGYLPDEGHDYAGGLFDVKISEIPVAGQSVRLVVPLTSIITSGAVYRRFSAAAGWAEFVVDANNAVLSATGEPGNCAAIASAQYTAGLTAGSYCVEVLIEDGGPNDADGVANGLITLLSGIAGLSDALPGKKPDDTNSGSPDGGGGGGGGSPAAVLLFLIFAVWMGRVAHRQSPRSRRDCAA